VSNGKALEAVKRSDVVATDGPQNAEHVDTSRGNGSRHSPLIDRESMINQSPYLEWGRIWTTILHLRGPHVRPVGKVGVIDDHLAGR